MTPYIQPYAYPGITNYHKPKAKPSTERRRWQHGYSYSEADKAFLIENNNHMSDAQLGKALNRSLASIQRIRSIMKLKRPTEGKMILRLAYEEAERMRTIEAKCIEIRRLQLIAANEPNSYKRFIAIDRLKKLSGIS